MLMKLDSTWLLFAVVAVAMLSFIFSMALDAVMKEAGFGAAGSAVIITAAFFGTIYAANWYGLRFSSLLDAVLAGVGGAFVVLLVLVLVKSALLRLL